MSESLAQTSLGMLREAESKGATFLAGGPEFTKPASLRPTILSGVTKDMAIFDEEAFGPSVSLYIADSDEHAIELANDSAYGLNAAVHSQDMKRALGVARRIETAQVHINSMTVHDERKCYISRIIVPVADGLTVQRRSR